MTKQEVLAKYPNMTLCEAIEGVRRNVEANEYLRRIDAPRSLRRNRQIILIEAERVLAGMLQGPVQEE